MKKTFLNWSSGKDASLSLHLLNQSEQFSVEALLCTVNKDLQRVSMHGLRESLLDKQAEAIGLPLRKVYLSQYISMEQYNKEMTIAVNKLKDDGYTHSAFGDIFLEDLRDYRVEQLQKVGLNDVFPLWKKDTTKLIRKFLNLGFKAIVVCVNAKLLDKSFAGRILDEDFLKDLPQNVDPCGENGEFHTFVFDGPIFKYPIAFERGPVVSRSYKPTQNSDDCFSDDTKWDTEFWFCDLLEK